MAALRLTGGERPAFALQPLATFLAAARSANVDNREAALAAVAERQQSLAAIGRLLPSASARGVYTRNELAPIVNIPSSMPGKDPFPFRIQPYDQWDAFLGADAPVIDLAGWLRAQAARRNSGAALENVQAVRLSVEGQVARVYYQLIGAAVLRRSAEHSLAAQQSNATLVTERRAGGIATQLDVSRAQAEVERARQNLADAELGLVLAHRALLTLTGVEPDGEIVHAPDDLHEESPLESWNPQPAALPAMRMAAEQRRAAAANATGAKLTLLPSLNATFLERFTNAAGFLGANNYYTFSLNLTWRLDVSIIAAMKVQATQAEIARVREERVRLTSRDATYEAWNRVRSGIAKSRAARAQAEAATLAAQYADERYSNGAGTQLDVVQAQRDAYAAEVGRVQADADLAFARALLRLNAGIPLDKDVK